VDKPSNVLAPLARLGDFLAAPRRETVSDTKRDSIPGFKIVLTVIGLVYMAMGASMVARGVGALRPFGVPEEIVASPVVSDFFTFFYELMMCVGALMVLFGHVTVGRTRQIAVAATFMVLDVLAIWLAFAMAMRGSKAFEVLTLWPGALELKRVDGKGHEEVLKFAPRDVRFIIDRDFHERVTALWLKDETRRLPVGAFLSPDEMTSLSKAFGTALRKARG
jgi:uncharacterized membrane protein